MITFRRRTRETLRHERAVVLQELGAVADADPRVFWEANKLRSAELRRAARRRGGDPDVRRLLGLVTGKPLAGGKGTPGTPCKYCGIVGGHNGNCPVIS